MTDKKISALGHKIVEILSDAGGKWLTRRDLAAALNRPNFLQPHDLRVLGELESAGLIESRKHQTGTIKFAFEYRAIQQQET